MNKDAHRWGRGSLGCQSVTPRGLSFVAANLVEDPTNLVHFSSSRLRSFPFLPQAQYLQILHPGHPHCPPPPCCPSNSSARRPPLLLPWLPGPRGLLCVYLSLFPTTAAPGSRCAVPNWDPPAGSLAYSQGLALVGWLGKRGELSPRTPQLSSCH